VTPFITPAVGKMSLRALPPISPAAVPDHGDGLISELISTNVGHRVLGQPSASTQAEEGDAAPASPQGVDVMERIKSRTRTHGRR